MKSYLPPVIGKTLMLQIYFKVRIGKVETSCFIVFFSFPHPFSSYAHITDPAGAGHGHPVLTLALGGEDVPKTKRLVGRC